MQERDRDRDLQVKSGGSTLIGHNNISSYNDYSNHISNINNNSNNGNINCNGSSTCHVPDTELQSHTPYSI